MISILGPRGRIMLSAQGYIKFAKCHSGFVYVVRGLVTLRLLCKHTQDIEEVYSPSRFNCRGVRALADGLRAPPYAAALSFDTPHFSEKKAPAAVHHTHTGHKNTRNVTFSEKKAPAAVHHTHTGHKNTRNPGTADITNGSGYFCDVMPWPLIGFGMDL